jgi:hypothetical protein
VPKLNYDKIVFIIVIAYALAYLIVVSNYGGAFTSDAQLHLRITQAWEDGHNPLVDERFFGNKFPYPPAFHFSLSLLPISPPTTFALVQILLFPCIVLVTYWFAKEFYGGYAGTVAVCLAISGFAFWDRPGQVIPNSFDILLLPILFYFYIKDKNVGFVITSTYLIYNHLFYPMGAILALFGYSLIRKRRPLKNFMFIGILCIPLIYLYIPHIFELLAMPQQELGVAQFQNFKNNPLWIFCYLGYPLTVAIFFIGYYFIKKKKSEIDWIMLVWIAGFIPLLVKFPHRAVTFLSQPLAILGGMVASRMIRESKKQGVLTILLIIAIFYLFVQISFITPSLRGPTVMFFEWLFIGWINPIQ